MTSQTVHMTAINDKIENRFENIKWVLFKLGSSNLPVHQVRHKMIPSMLLPRQPFFAAGHINVGFIFSFVLINKTCSPSVSLYRDLKQYGQPVCFKSHPLPVLIC